MSRYGIDVYGAAYYGADGLLDYDTEPFRAVGRNHHELELTWTAPTGAYDQLRLVRNAYGNPVNENDGVVLLEATAASPVVAFTDTGLSEGAFYYYSIFVREPIGAGFRWHRAGDTSGLVITDYGYSELLLERLPTIFTTTPPSTATRADQATLLSRFLSLFGFQLDAARTTLETLRDTKDPDSVSGVLLPLLAAELGQGYEPEIGQRQMRVLLRNSVYIYKKKGTTTGALALASALTGWGATSAPFTNLLLSEDDASAEMSVGTWVVSSGPATLERRASDELDNPEVIPPGAVVGYRNADNSNASDGMFQVTGTGAGAVVLRQTNLGRVTVDPADGPITASVFLRDTGTSRVPQLAFLFQDRYGASVAAGAQTQSAGATASDWTRRQTVTTDPPAGAFYAKLELTYPVIADDEVQLFDAAQVEVGGAATPYRSSRGLRVQLAPSRTNLFFNPRAEVDTSLWTAGAGTTLTRWTDGTAYAFQLAAVAGATPSMSTTVDTAPETAHTVSVYVSGPVGSYTLTVGGSAVVVVSPVADVPVRLALTRTTPTAETTTTVEVSGPVGTTFLADQALAERGAALLPYFDGGMVGSLDHGWTGTEHASTSVEYPQRAVRDYRLKTVLPDYLPFGTNFSLEYADGFSQG